MMKHKYILTIILFCSLSLIFVSQSIAQTPIPTMYDIEWSPDGLSILVGDTSGARVVDGETSQVLLSLPVQSIPVWEVAWSPDGTKIATGE